MRMKIELDEGGAIEFVPKYTRPLDYAMLLPDADKTGKIYDIQFLSESVSIPANNMQGKDQGLLTLRGVNFQEPLKVFALVEGGWLPPPFVYPSNLLVDRNVLSSLQRVKSGHGRHDQQSTDWWMQFFQEGTPIINPLLCALEGHQRRPLSFDEFRGAFEKASADAIALFPGASVVKYDLVRFKTAYRIISDLSERTSNEIDFLVKTAPLISVRAPDSRLSRIESEILEVARALRLDLISLPVLAALSCLYENYDGTGFLTARRLVKPRPLYTEKDAYNAISDMRAIEVTLTSRATTKEPLALCTCDLAVALFWCGLEFSDVRYAPGSLEFAVAITDTLFPRLGETDRSLLMDRLSK